MAEYGDVVGNLGEVTSSESFCNLVHKVEGFLHVLTDVPER